MTSENKKKVIKNWLIFIILNIFANFLNYFSNIIIAWRLSNNDYGKVIWIFSLIVLFAIPTQIIQIYISNNTADTERNDDIFWLFVFFTIIWLIINWLLLCFNWFFTNLLHINFNIFFLVITQTILVFPLYVIRWFLQWNKEFSKLWISTFIEVIVKFALIIFFIFIMNKWVISILIAVNISVFCSFLYSYFNIKELSLKKFFTLEISNIKKIFRIKKSELWYFFNLLIGISWTFALINMDMVLAQNFIPTQSWVYAVYSRLWQIIFMWWVIFISITMPYIINSYSRKLDTKPNFIKWFMAILICSLFWLWFYYLFPEFIILKLFKKNIVDNHNLFFVWLSYLFIVLSYFIANYFLSIKKYFINIIIIGILIFYWANIYLYHYNLENFIFVLLRTSILYFTLSSLYIIYFKLNKNIQSSEF